MKNKITTWKSLLPVFFIVFLDLLSLGIVIPVLTPLFYNPETSVLPHSFTFAQRSIVYGLLNAVYPLAQFFAAPILGALSDKYGRKKILLMSLIGTAFANLLFGIGIWKEHLSLLFFSRLFDGITAGNISIATSSVADISTEKTKSRNFGIVGVGYALGFILGPVVGSRLSDPAVHGAFNLSTPFWFATGFSILSIGTLLLFFKETLHTKLETKINLLTSCHLLNKAFKIKNLRIMFIIIFLLTFGFNFFTYFFQVLLFEKYNYSERQVGTFFAYTGIWIVIALGVLNNIISKKYPSHKILMYSILFLALALLLLLFPKDPRYLYVIAPFVAIFYSLNQPNTLSIVSNLSSEETQGEVMGIQQSIQSLATAIPPIIAGFAISRNLNAPILLAASSTILAWILYLTLFNRKLRFKKEEKFHE